MNAVRISWELGYEPILRDPVPRLGLDPVTACWRQVARADVVLAIIGFRRTGVPPPKMGGDGLRPWTAWEVAAAFEHRVPVVALLAGEGFSSDREPDIEAAALMSDLRGELARIAWLFDDENVFCSLVGTALHAVQQDSWSAVAHHDGLRLRRFVVPPLPPEPYPLLLPHTHPELMAGRDEDLEDLRRALALPVTVVGLHAASGIGKSSLLAGGLVPRLRAEGRPVAFERYPAEPGLSARLLGDLLEGEDSVPPAAPRSPWEFVDRLLVAGRLANGEKPLLVIDQFEDLLKDGREPVLVELGPLLAASAQPLPGFDGPACLWILAYRQEYHGRVVQWLEDVLQNARALGRRGLKTLPHDLSGRRFLDWELRPLGTPRPGSGDPLKDSMRLFMDAVEKPLRQEAFPWTFALGHARRLARAFAETRLSRPDDPLAPELQVVLAHLLAQASEQRGSAIIRVPENANDLIGRALQQHLRRALDWAFPHGPDSSSHLERTRALLVLRELADAHGHHGEDLVAEALGEQRLSILQKLSTARTRLVLPRRQAGAWIYGLSHDRLAEILVQAVDKGDWAELDIDQELIELRRLVVFQSRLFASGDLKQATDVPTSHFKSIDAHQEILLWTQTHRSWWQACRVRRRSKRRRLLQRLLKAAAWIFLAAAMVWFLADRRARYLAELAQVSAGEPETAFATLDRLTRKPGYDSPAILERLLQREQPFDIFERGLGGADPSRLPETLIRIAELAMPILEASPEDPVKIASLVWALDFFARHPAPAADRSQLLRNQALKPLRRKRPAPSPPRVDDSGWSRIPSGSFLMGAGPDEGRNLPSMQDEFPRHRVSISAFRMATHEVTNAEYRRLFPDHEGADDLPATGMSWFAAYTYAAWRGARLPTEAEWEYAARASCAFAYCKGDGSEVTLSEVAWWVGNSADLETSEPSPRPIRQLEPNPFGLWDIYGNVWEWTASWDSPYSETPQVDPIGPPTDPKGKRISRSGSYIDPRRWVSASGRASVSASGSFPDHGLRLVIELPTPTDQRSVQGRSKRSGSTTRKP